MNKHTVALTDKELYLLWSVICWFDKPVTSTLRYKLSGMASSPLRHGLQKRYDRAIEDRIIKMGKSLERLRAKEPKS